MSEVIKGMCGEDWINAVGDWTLWVVTSIGLELLMF